MTWADILFFALIALFLGKRLYDVLGTTTDEDVRMPNSQAQQAPILEGEVVSKNIHVEEKEKPIKTFIIFRGGDLKESIRKLEKNVAVFDEESFIEGAKYAFEMILESFGKGDIKDIKSFVSKEVYAAFEEDIKNREKNEERRFIDIIRFIEADIKDISVKNYIAEVDVVFQSEQMNVLKDKNGKVLEGDENRIDTVSDIWTFSKDIRSKDPNWMLIDTKAV